ncbi:uncharacterized protein LOC109846491 isoform X2 [Asparagus officinalis]|uniref:uncharacterized protein LOC109846491 isoform X2 n=1 Tax=Asparagus officinalis TaxID=4686 RepID=UPI00098E46CA|nr:uncharacterized protein LOC109846491 isoform X2 [Asparagus officinalis]
MSNRREVNCPLCTEAMDLTDQQFKPCKCGYQMCVWCWNHLVEEAEKDAVLCPACRNPYDKERIKRMTISSVWLAEISCKEKEKIQRAKSNTSEMRYDPHKIRVVQRNLVYITGIPVNLSNEETLRKREFFGQYGKVLKIYIKPTKPGSPYFKKSSVIYVTYSNEEEAVRCIQLVNGFILNDSPLKACHGTSRHCYAWLQKKPCKNPDCPYLHYPVPAEDMCQKDEVPLTCTRHYKGRQTALHSQQCSGSSLPQPTDGFCSIIEKPLASSSPSGCGKKLTIGEDESPTPSSSDSTVACDRAPSACAAFGEEPLNTSTKFNSSRTLSTGMISHVPEEDLNEIENKKKILILDSQKQSLSGHQNHESSKKYCQSDYLLEHILSSSEENPRSNNSSSLWGNDDITEDIIPDTHWLDSREFKQPTLVADDSAMQTSLLDYPISILQAMALSTSQDSEKVPPHINWDGASSDWELMNLASDFEATCTPGNPKSVNTYNTAGVNSSRKIGECSKLPDNDKGTSAQGEQHRVQNVDPWYEGDLRNGMMPDENYANSRQDGVNSNIPRWNHIVADHLDNPQNLADHLYSINRGGDCSNVPYSWSPFNSSDTRSAFAILGSANQTSSLYQPASPIAKAVISRQPRYPPGFTPRNMSNEGQLSSRSMRSGNAQFNFSRNQSLANSSQIIPSNNSLFSVEPIDALKMVSRAHHTSPDYSHLLVDDSGRRLQYQLNLGSSMYQDQTEVDQDETFLSQMALYGGQQTYHRSGEASTFSSPTAIDPRVIGRRTQSGLTKTTNTGHHQLQQPF